ncbi:MAG: family 78 glycoside hydrolase catalytic domain [Dysgonamonadaceae bacterium]
MRNIILFLLFLSIVSEPLIGFSISAITTNEPIELRCQFIENPYGVDVIDPVLSWTIKTSNPTARDIRQTAYQVLVASSIDLLKVDKADMWNSGKVISNQMSQVVYAGKALQSSQQYWWKVRVWNEKSKISVWSTPTQWTMGVLNAADWKAQWISANGAEKYAIKYQSARQDINLARDLIEYRKANKPNKNDPNYSSMLLRKEFEVKPELRRAVIHVCGLGHYELNINGKKVGDYLLAPGWTDYRFTALYDTYDVTGMLSRGDNAIGLILSNGMYNIQLDSIRYVKFLNSYGPLKAKLQLQLEYADGTTKYIGTDETWRVSPGPIIYMNEYGGEDFDARLVEQGWDKASFKCTDRWVTPTVLPDTGMVLKGLSCAAPPIKAIETLIPIKKTELKPNVWVYDLGQNTSIMPELKVKGAKGSTVRITPSELLYPDGSIDRRSASQHTHGPAWWQYTLNGEETQTYFPKFFYQGARYLQVELFPADNKTKVPEILDLKGIVVHSSATPIGDFSCSNELFNRIYSLVRWAQRSNMMSYLTDCPAREKMAWLEQYHLNGPSLRYNFDLLTLFRKGMNDMHDSQWENGFVPNVSPELFYAGSGVLSQEPGNALFMGDPIANGLHNSPEWGSSFIIVPWQQYLFSGDVSLIKRYFERMKRYLSFLHASSKDNLLYFGLGDWYDMGPKDPWGSQLTPIEFTASAIYYYDYEIMAKMATLIGEKNDALQFEKKAAVIRKAFNDKFFDADKGIYSTGSNTAMAMPLALGIAYPQYRKIIASNLVANIRKNGNSFTSGDVGYRYLLKALAMEGYSDLIYEMNNQSDKPGYGYQLKMGATALTEKWNADGAYMGSQNHFMLGQINEWLFHDLIGIGFNEDGDGAGFRKIIIKPIPVGDLKWVKGSYQTISGTIRVEWRRENGAFELKLSIPANTSATVYIPATLEKEVTESGKPVSGSKGVRFQRMEKDRAVYEIGSGEYNFISKEK